MEAKYQSKKRKHPSYSNPFIGIFTRSKSQIFIHRNRSGRSRSDSTRKRKHHANFEKPLRKLRTSNHQDISQIDAMSHISIKDLLARRVFSPTSIIDECCPKSLENEGTLKFDYIKPNLNDAMLSESIGEVEKLDTGFSCMAQKDNLNPNLNDVKLSESIGEVEKLDTGFSCIAQKDNLNPNLQSITDHSRSKKDDVVGAYCDDRKNSEMDNFKEGFTCMSEDSNGVNLNSPKTEEGLAFGYTKKRSEEDCINQPVEMTSEVNGNGGIREENGNFWNRGIDRSNRNSDGRNEPISESKLVSCSRRTLFKTPSSFNFRRLLPILMEVTKDRSCSSKIGNFHSSLLCKVQNSNDRNPSLSLNEGINASGEDENPSADSDDRRLADNDKFVKKLPCKVLGSNDVSSNLIQTKGDGIIFDVEQSCVYAELSNGVDEMIEECAQMTPPDVDIFCKLEENSNLENGEDNYLKTEYHHSAKPVNGSIRRNENCVGKSFNANIYGRKNSTLKSQLVLNPCSRPKVFRTPTSFSYRRLLPFLTNIATDDSCASKGSQCPEEENIERRSQITAWPSACQAITKDTSTTGSFLKDYDTCDTRPNLPTAALNTLNHSSDDELNLLSVKSMTDMQMTSDSQEEHILQVQDIPKMLESNIDDANSVNETMLSSRSPVNPQTFHGDGALEVSHCFIAEEKNKVARTEFSKDVSEPVETVALDQNSCQLGACVPFGIPIDGLPRGILKRNPQGCRGLCNCLNCASFRLHANRAFEFSRNQMQDAEEVILELIKELSCLRGMMEKSTADASYHVTHINQVREACMKAVKGEELARNRLSQMNCDLNIHCRSICLQRPRVSFANSIEEKVIPKADLPTRWSHGMIR